MALPHLTGSYFDTLDDKLALLQTRVADLEGAEPATLAARITLAEGDIAAHAIDITDLQTWRDLHRGAIASITLSASATSVSILGIEVPTASAFSGLVDLVNDIKGKVNVLIERHA